jgi:hypothetical protein
MNDQDGFRAREDLQHAKDATDPVIAAANRHAASTHARAAKLHGKAAAPQAKHAQEHSPE